MPWLNRIDDGWIAEILDDAQLIYVLEDHAPVGGLGECPTAEGMRITGVVDAIH